MCIFASQVVTKCPRIGFRACENTELGYSPPTPASGALIAAFILMGILLFTIIVAFVQYNRSIQDLKQRSENLTGSIKPVKFFQNKKDSIQNAIVSFGSLTAKRLGDWKSLASQSASSTSQRSISDEESRTSLKELPDYPFPDVGHAAPSRSFGITSPTNVTGPIPIPRPLPKSQPTEKKMIGFPSALTSPTSSEAFTTNGGVPAVVAYSSLLQRNSSATSFSAQRPAGTGLKILTSNVSKPAQVLLKNSDKK
jgi:hypothetical protein